MDLMQPPAAAAVPPTDKDALAVFPPHLMYNTNEFASTRTLAFLFTGAVSGVLGLENLSGFAMYFVTLVAVALMTATLQCGGKPARYFQGGWGDLLSIDQDGFLAFLLVWIGVYALVHVYD